MNSIRLRIRDAILLALNTSRPGGVPVANGRRYIPGEPLRDAEMGVFLLGESAAPGGGRMGPLTARELRGVVQPRAIAFDSSHTEDAVDAALRWCTEILFDAPKPTAFGELIHDIEELGTTYEVVQGDQLYVVATLQFLVRYQTQRADLTLRS